MGTLGLPGANLHEYYHSTRPITEYLAKLSDAFEVATTSGDYQTHSYQLFKKSSGKVFFYQVGLWIQFWADPVYKSFEEIDMID